VDRFAAKIMERKLTLEIREENERIGAMKRTMRMIKPESRKPYEEALRAMSRKNIERQMKLNRLQNAMQKSA